MLKNKRYLLKSLLVIAIVMSSIFMLTGCGKKNNDDNNEVASEPYLQPIIDYFEGIKNKDINQVLKAFPDFMEMDSKISSSDIDDLYAQYESLYGANIKIDYTFGEVTALSEDDFTELEEEIKSIYTDMESVDITAGYIVPVTVTITGDKIESTAENAENENKEETEKTNNNVEEDEMYVFQYNGNWYMM